MTSFTDVFLNQGVLGAMCVALIGAVVYQARQITTKDTAFATEREGLLEKLAEAENGKLLEAQARVADAKEVRQFMAEFQNKESDTIKSLDKISDQMVRAVDDLRRSASK